MAKEASVKLSRVRDTNIAKLSIQNPPYNQISSEVLFLIEDLLKKVKGDERTQALIIEGKGLFSVGADVKEIWAIAKEGNAEKARELLTKVNAVINALESLGKPTPCL